MKDCAVSRESEVFAFEGGHVDVDFGAVTAVWSGCDNVFYDDFFCFLFEQKSIELHVGCFV